MYTFTLNSFKITDTRSQHKDSDFVSVAVAVGSNPPITLPTKSMGDLNNGIYQVNLSIANIDVPAGQVAAFSYSIANTGHAKDTIGQALQKLSSSAASKAAVAGVGTLAGGPIGTVGVGAANWALEKVLGVVFADCDGPVAAGIHSYTGAQLAQQTAGGQVISVTDENKGSDSNWGCGGNSHYFVTWSIAAQG